MGLSHSFLFLYIEFIGVILVPGYNSIMSSVYYIVCPPPRQVFHHHLLPFTLSYPPYAPLPLSISTLSVSVSLGFLGGFLLNLFTFLTQLPNPPPL